VFATADVFVELDGSGWETETAATKVRVLIEGEPAWFQMNMENSARVGERLEEFDYYYEGHCRAAREVAEAYFDSDAVLTKLIADVFGAER
jgi:hypothetical protein